MKIITTSSCGLLEVIHIADYSPDVEYSTSEIVFRFIYFFLSGCSWMLSSILVYFDYSRKLKSQWKGQRIYWILQLVSNSILLLLNIVFDKYDFNSTFYQFSLIQILSYCFIISCCALLSYCAVLKPDDFKPFETNMYEKLRKSRNSLTGIRAELSVNEIKFKVNITGYKIKQVSNSKIINYNIHVTLNETTHNIYRSLTDFEALDNSLREKFAKSKFYAFPQFSMLELRGLDVDNRGKTLCTYLTSVCREEFMSPDLLNFLQIEGNYRDLLTYKHDLILEEKIRSGESYSRTESVLADYYSPRPVVPQQIKKSTPAHLQWVVKVSIPTFNIDEMAQTVYYYIKAEIPALGFEKIRACTLKDFINLHKALKKALHPGCMIKFPDKEISQNAKDESSIEANKCYLESYLIEILNDPAYICQEALDFICCDNDFNDVLELIPEFYYRITEEIGWEWEISEDSTHFMLYNVGIAKKTEENSLEKEWKFSKRYKDFDSLNKKLMERQNSPFLKNYALKKGKNSKNFSLPGLPGKKISSLSTLEEIEERKKGLENYINELINNLITSSSFALREFLSEYNE